MPRLPTYDPQLPASTGPVYLNQQPSQFQSAIPQALNQLGDSLGIAADTMAFLKERQRRKEEEAAYLDFQRAQVGLRETDSQLYREGQSAPNVDHEYTAAKTLVDEGNRLSTDLSPEYAEKFDIWRQDYVNSALERHFAISDGVRSGQHFQAMGEIFEQSSNKVADIAGDWNQLTEITGQLYSLVADAIEQGRLTDPARIEQWNEKVDDIIYLWGDITARTDPEKVLDLLDAENPFEALDGWQKDRLRVSAQTELKQRQKVSKDALELRFENTLNNAKIGRPVDFGPEQQALYAKHFGQANLLKYQMELNKARTSSNFKRAAQGATDQEIAELKEDIKKRGGIPLEIPDVPDADIESVIQTNLFPPGTITKEDLKNSAELSKIINELAVEEADEDIQKLKEDDPYTHFLGRTENLNRIAAIRQKGGSDPRSATVLKRQLVDTIVGLQLEDGIFAADIMVMPRSTAQQFVEGYHKATVEGDETDSQSLITLMDQLRSTFLPEHVPMAVRQIVAETGRGKSAPDSTIAGGMNALLMHSAPGSDPLTFRLVAQALRNDKFDSQIWSEVKTKKGETVNEIKADIDAEENFQQWQASQLAGPFTGAQQALVRATGNAWTSFARDALNRGQTLEEAAEAFFSNSYYAKIGDGPPLEIPRMLDLNDDGTLEPVSEADVQMMRLGMETAKFDVIDRIDLFAVEAILQDEDLASGQITEEDVKRQAAQTLAESFWVTNEETDGAYLAIAGEQNIPMFVPDKRGNRIELSYADARKLGKNIVATEERRAEERRRAPVPSAAANPQMLSPL